MKILLTVMSLGALVPGWAQAEPETIPSAVEVCTNYGVLAEVVMQRRQEGVSLTAVLALLPPAQQSGLIGAIVRDAYDVPRYQVVENQVRAVEDFRNVVETDCIRAFDAAGVK